MSNDVSRVYQFLAKQEDWVTKADKSGDGAITKSEFRQFMEANFEWDGETTDAGKNDLINSFWKTIDTNKNTTKIKGTNVKNNNALDKNEQAAMENRIKMYETFNEFNSQITCPTIIASTSEWKNSVSAGLSALVEKAIKDGKTPDELTAILEEAAPGIQNKATADYCAVEYLNSTMKEIVNEYGYAYGSDNTLQGMLNTYIKSLTGDENGASIKETVTGIVDAYLATAGLKEDNAVDLSDYGYTATEESALNDLQQCILKKTLETNLAELKNEADYANYSDLYDKAINEYISNTVANTKQGDLEAAKGYGIEEFKATKSFKDIETTISVKNTLIGDELHDAVSSRISGSVADIIQKDGRYLKVFADIQEQATKKALAGEFDSNGEFDASKLVDWAVNQIENRIAEFYPNGLGDMNLEDLNTMYDKLAAAELKEPDNDKSLAQTRDAAIQYCKALSAKGTLMKEAVKTAFNGENYATTINKMYPSQIDEVIGELKEKALEIGDISTFTVGGWSGIGDSISILPNTTNTFSIGADVKNGNTPISPDRIQYKTNNSNATVENGVITIKAPATDSTYEIKVTVTVDGEQVGEAKTIKVVCKQKDATNLSSENNILINGAYVSDAIANRNNRAMLSSFHRNGGSSLQDSKNAAKESVRNLLTSFANDLIAAGYNATKVQLAVATTINYYTAAIDAMSDQQCSKGRSDKSCTFSYVDANGQSRATTSTYWQTTYKYESSASDSASKGGGEDINSTGLILGESYSKTNTYCVYINTGTMLNKFMSFMSL